jgi:hypothetical protein
MATAAGLAAAGLVPRADGAEPEKPSELSGYQDGPQVWVRQGNDVLTSYRAHPSQKYPYFYPLNSLLSGLSLTTESGTPWPHHRSVCFGCDRVNGGNYWQDPIARGQIVSSGPALKPVAKTAVGIVDHCEWRQPGQAAVLVDERQYTVTLAGPRLWFLDAQIKLTARQAVQVLKTNHSLFAIRAAADIAPAGGGQLINSEGKTGEKATFGQVAAWCDFSGPRAGLGNKFVEGIALMDHPHNPWAPCRWFTRDYGFMSPTPFNWLDDAGWKLPAGASVTLLYRVVVHAGDAKEAGLAGIYQKWSGVRDQGSARFFPDP